MSQYLPEYVAHAKGGVRKEPACKSIIASSWAFGRVSMEQRVFLVETSLPRVRGGDYGVYPPDTGWYLSWSTSSGGLYRIRAVLNNKISEYFAPAH